MSRASAQAARRHSSSGGAPSSRPARAHYAQPIVHKKGVFAQDAAVTSHARSTRALHARNAIAHLWHAEMSLCVTEGRPRAWALAGTRAARQGGGVERGVQHSWLPRRTGRVGGAGTRAG